MCPTLVPDVCPEGLFIGGAILVCIARTSEVLPRGRQRRIVALERDDQEIGRLSEARISQGLRIDILRIDVSEDTFPLAEATSRISTEHLISVLLSLLGLIIIEVEACSEGIGSFGGEVEALDFFLVVRILLQEGNSSQEVLLDQLIRLLECATWVVRE